MQCLACWVYSVGWRLCCVGPLGCISASLVSLILMVSVSPISSLLLHSQPTVHITHKTFLTHTHPTRKQRSHKHTWTHTHIQNYDRTSSFIIHSGQNQSHLSSFFLLFHTGLLLFTLNPVTEMATCIFTPRITFSPTPHEFTSNPLAVGWGDGGKDLLPWRRGKMTTFNFPCEIIYSCLYWSLLKGGKKIGRENCSLVRTICCYVTNRWEVTGFEMEGPFYLVTAAISEQPTFLFGFNVVYPSTLGFVQAVFRFVGGIL